MNISTITNLKQLANFLRCDVVFLKAYLEGDYHIIDRRISHDLPISTGITSIIEKLYLRKKNTFVESYREIYSVKTDTLKNALKGLSTYIKNSHKPSMAVHGYVRGKNIRTNAEAHLAKKHLMSVDITKFFETITKAMVEHGLSSVGFSEFAARNLSHFVTIDNFLPPGFSTSPVISNLVLAPMDEQLAHLCQRDCIYTRYADDLYFSSNITLPPLDDINAIIIANSFTLNPQKTKYMPRGSKQYVTGLTVFDFVRPRITKKIKRNLRLEIYYLVYYGLQNHALHKLGYTLEQYTADKTIKLETDSEVNAIDGRITGWLRFMNSVERPAAQKLSNQYKKVKL